MRARFGRFTALVVSGLLVVGAAACGDDDDDTSSAATVAGSETTGGGGDGGGGDDVVAAAQERIADHLALPTDILVTDPLPAPPEPGRTIYWIPPNVESIEPITDGYEDATEAIGWNLVTLLVDPTDPQGFAAAIQQAVSENADYIAVSGSSIDAYGESLEAAKAAGIPILDMYSTDEVGGADNGIYANVGGTAYTDVYYPRLLDWVIQDSGGTGKIALVNIPDFPILASGEAAIDRQMAECPDCELIKIQATVADLTSGGIAGLVVSALQSDPSIGYIYLTFGDLGFGLAEALDAAGVGQDTKIVTGSINPALVASVADGTFAAAVPNPQRYAAWTVIDAALRLEQDIDIVEEQHSVLPIPLYIPDNVPTPPGEYEGPDGYQDQYLALWGLD